MSHLSILGAAHIHTPNFVKTLGGRPDHTTLHVWDHQLERAKKTAALLDARPTTKLDEALGADIDAVIVCAETVRHEALVGAACSAGKHVFVEKPLGMGHADSLRIAAAIEQAHVRFQTGFFMRSNPIHRFLKTEIGRGTFGRITHVRMSNCHAGSLKGWFDGEWRWMADPALAGVGAFGDLGAHAVDLLVWFIGRVQRVSAELRVVTGRYGDCDELGESMLVFDNGTIGSVVAGWVDVVNPVTLTIAGTEGHAWVSNGQLYVDCERLAANGRSPLTSLPTTLPHAFDQFLDALSGRPAGLISPREAAYGCTVMDTMYAAARERRWLDVPT